MHDPSWFPRDAGVRLMVPPISEVKGLLGRYDLKARKSLGQHFLVDRGALHRIVAAADLTPDDVVIEIGPGLGVLTRELAKVARRVVAVEADEGMAFALGDVMAGSGNVTIVNADALRTEPGSLVAGEGIEAQEKRLADTAGEHMIDPGSSMS